MGKILDFVVDNTFVFVLVIIVLVALLGIIVLSIVKSFNKHKIPIYEDINENVELENAKEENIIEKPVKKEEVPETQEITEESVELEENLEEAIVELKEETEQLEVEEFKNNEIIEDLEEIEEFEEQFDDEALREELEKIDDKEIEERIDEEHKRDIDEEIKENDNDELKEILSGMKDTNEVDPDEVVRNFEEEQEAQSIISYQELVNVVKNRENDFDDELESRPLATVSDFIKKDNKSSVEPEANVLEMIQQLDNAKKENVEVIEDNNEEDIEVLEVFESEPLVEELKVEVKETLPEIPEEGRFKKTDVISPVFGRIQEKNKIDYPKVEKFDRRPKVEPVYEKIDDDMLKSVMPDFSTISSPKEDKKVDVDAEMKSVSMMFEDISNKVEEKTKEEVKDRKAGNQDLEDIDEIESLSAISKNEDFLKALRDFRNSL